jgi:hypothetical protein
MSATNVVFEPFECRNRLAELGLDEDGLIQCVERGQSAWAECTPNHPAIYKGLCAWGETTCGLREYLLPKSWKRVDEGNLPVTINKANTIAIIVSTGNEDTGRKEGKPSTKSTKGARTAEAIACNLEHTLFGDIRKITKNADGKATYMLLFHRDEELEEVRCELSRPLKINEDDDRIDEWTERIILRPIPFSSGSRILVGDGPQTPNIDVEIKRRSA